MLLPSFVSSAAAGIANTDAAIAVVVTIPNTFFKFLFMFLPPFASTRIGLYPTKIFRFLAESTRQHLSSSDITISCSKIFSVFYIFEHFLVIYFLFFIVAIVAVVYVSQTYFDFSKTFCLILLYQLF